MENAETERQSLYNVSFSVFLSLLGTVLTYFTLIRKVWLITCTKYSFPQCRPLNLLQIHSSTSIISAPGLLTQRPLDMRIEERWEMRASSITRQGSSDTIPEKSASQSSVWRYYWDIKTMLNCGQKLSGAMPALSVVGQPNSFCPFLGKEWTSGMLWPSFRRQWMMLINRERKGGLCGTRITFHYCGAL